MSDDLKLQESVKKTQELLGKYIKKPPLTDKLLKKPPFRFLHDIINAIIKETGFLKNLFTDEESNSSNIKDKEAKLVYLNKLIDAVKLITGIELSVRSSKIISGQEPIKTNELLQTIGRALDKKVSSTEAVEYYKKSLEKKESSKNKSRTNASPDDKPKKTEKKSSPAEIKPKSREKIGEKNDKTKREITKSSSRDSKIRDASTERHDSRTKRDNNKKKEAISDSSKKRRSQVSTEKRVGIQEKKISNKSTPSDESKNIAVVEPATIVVDTKEHNEEENINEVAVDEPPVIPIQKNKDEIIPEKVNDEPKEVMSPKQLDRKEEKVEDKVNNVVMTKTNVGLLRPPSARPPSARPAAPRTRGKPDFILNNGGINEMGDVKIVVENFGMKKDDDDDDDDDADNMVVMETATHDDSISVGGSTDLLNTQLTQEHGYLVAQILETQKELINEGNVELIPNKVEIEWEAGLKKDRDVIVKEMDKLRGTIQTLTRTTNPLGKLLDFLQEDAEIMEKELQDWRHQFGNVREQLIVEKNMTTELIKPLEESLKEVENNIVMQMEKILQTKANIMKNNQKIQRLLSGK